MSKTALTWLGFMFLFLGTMTFYQTWKYTHRETPRGTEQEADTELVGADAEWLTEYELTERSGKAFHSRELAGQVHVASFFFSSCPGSCNQQNAHLAALHRIWGPKGVRFISITTDPERDTPEKLREYAAQYSAHPDNWLFLTGDNFKYIRRIGAEVYQVPVDVRLHMDRFVAVDKWGNVRYFCDWHVPEAMEQLNVLLAELLAEQQPPENPIPRSYKELQERARLEAEMEEEEREQADQATAAEATAGDESKKPSARDDAASSEQPAAAEQETGGAGEEPGSAEDDGDGGPR